MTGIELRGIIQFLEQAELLKQTTRTAWTTNGRQESVAAHTWRLCLMALLFESAYPQIDHHKLLKLCLVHDLGEAIHGDISAVLQKPDDNRQERERQDMVTLTTSLPQPLRDELLGLWEEYNGGKTAEARLAKALDKLETILQHNQGQNPADFDYGFNLEYGRSYTDLNPLTQSLREILDKQTAQRAATQTETVTT